MKFDVKYNVTEKDEDGEYDVLRETIAVLDYATKFVPATFDDPAEGGDFEYHFELPNGDTDTFAEENCSKRDREIIEEYMTLGDNFIKNRNFRRAHGWED